MTKMIPPMPTSAVMLPTPKQKIGFSIESIVGNDAAAASPPTPNNQQQQPQHHHHHLHHNNNSVGERNAMSLGMTTSLSSPGGRSDGGHSDMLAQQQRGNGSAAGPSSPPQTPPAGPAGPAAMTAAAAALLGRTMPPMPHLPLALPPHAHPHPNAHGPPHHLPHHLTPAQQHALHQHLLMQQPRFQAADGSPLRPDIQDILQRLHNSAAANASAAAAAAANLSLHNNGPYSPPQPAPPASNSMPLPLSLQTRLSPDDSEGALHLKRDRSPAPNAVENAQNPAQRHQPPHTPPKSVSPLSSQPSPPPPPSSQLGMPCGSPASSPQQYAKQAPPVVGPLLVPGMPPAGLIRPYPMGPGGPPPQQPPSMPDIKALPPYINAPPEMQPQHNPHLIAAAQFQMAAALQAGHVLGPAAAAAAAAGLPPHAAQFMQGPPGMPRDSYPLYPWLLSRHGRIFPHRFPGNFLLQPFRKPKRIRTAFSPSQLLKLEHAFESNQYVVGAERKALAQSLNLSETQVKVWFQNRRTKHKRMQQEDEKGGGGQCGGAGSDKNSHNTSGDEDDDELIDMEMDDCLSDDEHEHDLDGSH